tara:strand:+ start:649127 stop:651052 length:1926 start_codon:yes stop_codon:yes gene_type:complete
MRDSRNPFRLRRAESIDNDTTFLSLFEPGILEIVPTESPLESVHILRSAAGGGKTSLIRLFTPSVLLTLSSQQTNTSIRELHQRMKDIGAIGDSGPRVIGVMLTCGRGYSMLQDLEVEQSRKDRLFFGLLNARIILAVLRGAIALKQLSYPDGLDSIEIELTNKPPSLQKLGATCTGTELHRWAEQREATLCESLDSLGPLQAESLPGDDALHSLDVVRPDRIKVDGTPVAERMLLMMDDIHNLTNHQRSLLFQTVIEARSPIGIWIAERFEAMTAQEMFSSGAAQGRDYGEILEIESFWRSKHAKFEKLAMKGADRRVQAATGTELDSFVSCLQDSLTGAEWEKRFEEIAIELANRVQSQHGKKERFSEWIRIRVQSEGSPRERALEWRSLEILIHRELRKRQASFFDDDPLDEEDLGNREDSSLNNAAELFLAKEFGLPYYFGPERVSRLASLNIQQFLGLGGEIFEEAAAAELLRRPIALPPERQHALMKRMAKQLWDEIPRKVRHGRELRQFIESVGNFAHEYTYRPTAPNDPGVTGTAIKMSERLTLFDEATSKKRLELVRLADTLASALAHNLLVAQLDYSCKKEKWMVLNLNRLLCVHFDLPLGYGLYKERPLGVLAKWIDTPFADSNRQEGLL